MRGAERHAAAEGQLQQGDALGVGPPLCVQASELGARSSELGTKQKWPGSRFARTCPSAFSNVSR